MTPPAVAADANSIARNSSPLPRKTVAKSLSSYSPSAVPDNADKPQEGNPGERHQVQREGDGLALLSSQPPASFGSAGTDSRTSTREMMSRTENRMPATAAARGVVSRARQR